MNTPSPDPRTSEPLTPEERALAARLARLGPHGEPPPALDASIIGAAHAAAGRPAPRHRRWPALLGIAATLALAVGVTWQMQPAWESPAARDGIQQETARSTDVEPGSDAMAVPSARSAATEPPAEEVLQERHDTAPLHAPGRTAAEQPHPQAMAAPAPALRAAKAQSAPPPPPPPPAPAAPPSAPPAPPMQAMQAIDEAAAVQAEREAISRRMQDTRAESDAMRSRVESATAAAPASFPAQPADWPIAEDRQLEPTAWFERIRLRREAGDATGARESLRLLQEVHPHVAVPDDLRALADDRP